MTSKQIRDRIAEGCTLFGFEYHQKECHVDPCYTPSKGHEYLLFCDGSEYTVYTLENVMLTPFFDGKCLNDIAEDIEITEW